MKFSSLLIFFIFGVIEVFAQQTEGIAHSDQNTSRDTFPVTRYKELPNPVSPNAALWKEHKGIRISWGSTDFRYKKEEPLPMKKNRTKIKLHGWGGERVAAQWVVSAYDTSTNLSYSVSDLVYSKNKNLKIGSERLLTGFVRYVLTDELNKDGKGGCGYRDNTDFDSSLAADAIDPLTAALPLPAQSTRPGWVRVWIPENARPGEYKGKVTLLGNGKPLGSLDLVVEVGSHILPAPSQWSFHLDLWQNPFAVARYYEVRPWSEAHFEHLRKDMKPYVDAGGGVITASIIHKPWNGQTYDPFETMVTWMKKADGAWYFDYTIFDKWVSFMMDLGVDKQINCYSMVPWKLSFQYYDQATNQLRFLETKPGDTAYENLWVTMLTSFAQHLKKKGWFDKTYIAMDERPMEVMKKTLKVIHKADKDFKVSLAGNLHPEIADEIDDYCISYGEEFTPERLKERKAVDKISTFYTSCSQPYPNTFTFSPPAESEWLAWHAAEAGLDGYLRWAYNSWVLEPLLDSRFTTWAAGDTYLIYPGGRSSIRFERLTEGIQQYEKVKILRKEFTKAKNKKGLQQLRQILAPFERLEPQKESAADQILQAKKALQKLEK